MLIGFRNRVNVLVNWAWNYFTYDRSARLIMAPPASAPGTADPVGVEWEPGPFKEPSGRH
jgi:NADH dehydrogenase